jgi:hypothetical protein
VGGKKRNPETRKGLYGNGLKDLCVCVCVSARAVCVCERARTPLFKVSFIVLKISSFFLIYLPINLFNQQVMVALCYAA